MTMQEAKQTMRYMESVFDVVRLLGADTLREIHYGDYTSKEPKAPCQCYDFWEKSSPCENCVSIRALEEKSRKVKMEFIDSALYQVIAKYMEIDGREYVMEMINCLDDELILDPQGKNRLLKKISGGISNEEKGFSRITQCGNGSNNSIRKCWCMGSR